MPICCCSVIFGIENSVFKKLSLYNLLIVLPSMPDHFTISYMHFKNELSTLSSCLNHTILVGLKVKTPPASFVTISLSVYPLNPILPLSLQVSPNLRCSQTDPVYLSIMKITFVFLIYYNLIIVCKNQMIFIYNFEAYDVYHRKPQITLFLKIFFVPNDCL